jgi:hypothetical protein
MNSLVARIFIPSFLRFKDVLLFFDEFSLQVTIILCESQEILFCKIFSNVLKPESLDSKTLRAHAMVYFCLSDILRMEGFPRLSEFQLLALFLRRFSELLSFQQPAYLVH